MGYSSDGECVFLTPHTPPTITMMSSTATVSATSAEALVAKYRGAIVLDTLCREKKWNAVIAHARAHPTDVWAKSVSVTGGSNILPPLHIACMGGAPIQVIKALLAANPAALQTTSGPQDRLPLHHLLATNFTPVESIVTALVEAYPEACRIADKAGFLPIHLACQGIHVSDTVFMSILAVYPEGAYARTSNGMYPLHLASSNTNIDTKKRALAALDRGTLYASISKMTSIRLTKKHEAEIKTMEVKETDKLKKMDNQMKLEQDKLKAQIESLVTQLNNEKEINSKLRDELKVIDEHHEKKLALVIKKEQATASSNENQLRLDLADVQLKNMDFLDQIESLQADLDTSNTKLMTQANEFNDIKNKMQTDINDLETSLLDARSCILSFIHEQEKVKVAMNAQKEAMTALLLGHDATINHNGRLTDSMIELVSKFDGIDAKHAEGKSGGGIMDETDSETEDEEEVYHTPKSGDVNV
jgi:hypothetical protein